MGESCSKDVGDGHEARVDRIVGSVLGLALGDALGLPYEGLSRTRVKRWRGDGALEHGFVMGRGMCSDDTEHACMVAQALLDSQSEPDAFLRSLARRLRWWLVGLPAGIGWATLRSLGRLWLGVAPQKSGVFSAGNGPAMRAPLIGACYGHEPERMEALISASTRLTHTDPKAFHGSILIARAAAMALEAGCAGTLDAKVLWKSLYATIEEPELRELCAPIEGALDSLMPYDEFADAMGLSKGITGYIYHTVPVSLYAWLRSPLSIEDALVAIIDLGGDTDTTAAIVGGLVGAGAGAAVLPQAQLAGVVEWPRTISWIRSLAERLALATTPRDDANVGDVVVYRPLPLAWPKLLLRNVIFFWIVICHGFRRIFPPYG